ncbi:carbohydrate-binding protein [Achlya hypogyna]|uniref:Carbohydrate-binding protein n=1 Tax=Achlya hypogyna TaxID=1202772 RepID=A0A1V9YRC2_ACHHY|nr:carbohydrate-binding protein [Achlya hypogyna]
MRRWLLFALAIATVRATTFTGDGTAYSTDWTGGNCGFKALWGARPSAGQTYFAAINNAQWDDKMNCGRCARVECTSPACTGAPVVVLITNRCPECLHGSLDFSNQAFLALTGHEPSRLPIAWEFVECPTNFVDGPVEYYVDAGSNNFWVGIQPQNFRQQIVSIEIKSSSEGTWRPLASPRANGITTLLFLGKFETAFPDGPFEVRSTSDDGQVLLDSFPSLTVGATLYGKQQFSSVGAAGTTAIDTTVPATTTASTTPKANSPSDSPSTAPATSPATTTFPVPTTAVVPATTVSLPTPVASVPAASSANRAPATIPCAGLDYELKVWPGGYAVHIYLDDELSNWRIDVSGSNLAAVSKSWNCVSQWTSSTSSWTLTNESYNARLPRGATTVGILGSTPDTTANATVASVVVTAGDLRCVIPRIGTPIPVPSTGEAVVPVSVGASTTAPATKAASAQGATPVDVLEQPRSDAATFSNPGIIFGLVVAVVATVVAIAAVVYAKIRRRTDKRGAILTPTHFSMATPVNVATL